MSMTHLLIGIDPSLSCTGVAALKWDGSAGDRGETLLRYGTLQPETRLKGVVHRALDLAGGVVGFVSRVLENEFVAVPDRLLIAVEAPRDNTFGEKQKRSNAHLPGYGVAVGAVAQAVDLAFGLAWKTYPTPGDWGSRFPTKGDTHKEGRVRMVEQMYRLAPGSLGAKSTAGNVADAILLARYARQKFELEEKYGAVGARR